MKMRFFPPAFLTYNSHNSTIKINYLALNKEKAMIFHPMHGVYDSCSIHTLHILKITQTFCANFFFIRLRKKKIIKKSVCVDMRVFLFLVMLCAVECVYVCVYVAYRFQLVNGTFSFHCSNSYNNTKFLHFRTIKSHAIQYTIAIN